MSILVTLHFPDGHTVSTRYPVAALPDALARFSQYVADGKTATITHNNE